MDDETPTEYATLTVVVRRDGTEGDPCETMLAGHPDVVFVGCQDGVTDEAFALGAEPSSWIDPDPDPDPAPAAASDGAEETEQTYGVMWEADFEARTPEEAAQLAYEQLLAYSGPDSMPPVLEVTDERGKRTTLDLAEEPGE
ncbi:hypothetical protein ACIBAC_00665 [Streptomyces sp. NPDC051362]|uniref:hypothetical protein n=1 Tax=Streptomyces sp. NPDC051362 TaxID=3365651 RepID=UPI0037A30342